VLCYRHPIGVIKLRAWAGFGGANGRNLTMSVNGGGAFVVRLLSPSSSVLTPGLRGEETAVEFVVSIPSNAHSVSFVMGSSF